MGRLRFAVRRVAAAVFRERALLHYPACCAASGLIALPPVILSRRACGASKNLPRPPKSDCYAIMPTFLHTNPIIALQDPSASHAHIPTHKPYYSPARSFGFAPRYSLGTSLRMTGRATWRRVAAAMFRERALLHYPACCAASGLIALPPVILSRRECGASKNLPRPPQSSCNALMPAFLYANPIIALQDPSASCLAIRSALRSG